MARHTFFSFHYQRDVMRASVVRQSWVTQDRKAAGFYEDGLWEKAQAQGDGAVKSLINRGMDGTGVTCVCIGAETWGRPWVRYELLKSFAEGKGLLGVYVHEIADPNSGTDVRGPNPFESLGFEVKPEGIRLKVRVNGSWEWSRTFPDPLPASSIPYSLRGATNTTFAHLFSTYDWKGRTSRDGYDNFGGWLETAARQAGR